MQNTTIHIKVKPEIAKGLKLLSKKRESSVGELAEEMGMAVWEIRSWLTEHNILQNNSFQENDIANA